MDAHAVIKRAQKRGIVFSIEQGRLIPTASRPFSDKETRLLREHREAIREVVSCPFYTTGLIASVLRGESAAESLSYLLDCPDTDENDRIWIERALSGWRYYDDSGSPAAPLQYKATTQEVSAENREIVKALLFNGGECAARLLVALCRLSDGLHEVERRLREGEPLGLWKRTDKVDGLGFPVWALTQKGITVPTSDTERRSIPRHGETHTEVKTIAPIMERVVHHADGSVTMRF